VNFLPVMLKRLIITGSGLRGRSDDFKAAIAAALKEKVWPLLEAGVVRPLIYKVVPAEQAAEAHRIMEAGEHTGKIILSWH
jgi:NADPH2:quinone reductase